MSAIAKIQEQPIGQVVSVGAAPLMEVISRAAADPNTDVDKLERLLGMYERITAQQAKAAFTSALAELQPKLPTVDERGSTDKTTYAKWEDINEAIRPLLHEHGFALNFRVSRSDGTVAVTGILSHAEGHAEETTLDLPVDTGPGRNAVQAVGSSVSYGKRYSAMALLNITSRAPQDRDDDGRRGGAKRMSQPAQDAFTDINACEDWPALERWREAKSASYRPKVNDREWQEIISLFNRRAAAFGG